MASLNPDDTIVAIASAAGSGWRGIVRISGPRALQIVEALIDSPLSAGREEAARDGEASRSGKSGAAWLRARPCRVPVEVAGANGGFPVRIHLDGFALLWRGNRSYTGQSAAELHLRAPRPLLERIVDRCVAAGARLANAGEFTLRAFLAGRLDLVQAEAILGVIHARDARSFDVALRQMAGGLERPFAELRERLLGLLADVEAGLDFVDEDIAFIDGDRLRRELEAAGEELDRLGARLEGRGLDAERPRVVLVGAPNAGKSSLFNALVGASRAIVADLPGTTRDWLEQEVEWEGKRLRLVDTAGVEGIPVGPGGAVDDCASEGGDPDQLAAVQTANALRHADLVLFCVDGSRPDAAGSPTPEVLPGNWVVVRTRADLPAAAGFAGGAVSASIFDSRSLENLRRLIVEKTAGGDQTGLDLVPATMVRCRDAIRLASSCLVAALDSVRSSAGDELVAVEIRLALDALGSVAGEVCNDDLLDRIFSRFCIGK